MKEKIQQRIEYLKKFLGDLVEDIEEAKVNYKKLYADNADRAGREWEYRAIRLKSIANVIRKELNFLESLLDEFKEVE